MVSFVETIAANVGFTLPKIMIFSTKYIDELLLYLSWAFEMHFVPEFKFWGPRNRFL